MKILGDMTAKSPRNIRVFQYLRRMRSMALLKAIISIFLETVVPYVRPQLQPVEESSAVDKKPGTGGGEPETAGASGRKLLASLLGTSPPSKRADKDVHLEIPNKHTRKQSLRPALQHYILIIIL